MSYNKNTISNHEDPLLYLDFHHHIILVRCNESSLLQKLRKEFHFFVSEETAVPEITIELTKEKAPEMPSMVATKILELAVVYRLGNLKYVDYFGEALTIHDTTLNNVKVYSENEERLFEIGFLVIHSLAGEKMDLDGFCRLHAVAVSLNKQNAIVMLPSKGGKSTLLKNLLENPEVKVVSDDMPLCDYGGHIHPFPSKISLNEKPDTGLLAELEWHEFKRYHWPPKWTASLSQMKDRLDHNSFENSNLLIAGHRLSSGESMLMKVSAWKMTGPLMEHMIVGIGLPQIIEMFLNFRFTDMFKMVRHFFIRAICAIQLARKSKCYFLYMGPDKNYNSQLILDLMYEHQDS
jgi:hypothetical protein